MNDIDPIAAAQAVSEPGTFSFMDRLLGRNMPKDSVVIYLDEASGYELKVLRKEHSKITDAEDPRLAEIEARIAEVEQKVRESAYTFHLEAIPSEKYDQIVRQIHEEMPAEQKSTVNPITNEVVQYEAEYPEREEKVNRRIWAEFIRAIEDPQGNRDEQITESSVKIIRENLPLAAQNRITRKIVGLRMAADWMDEIQDEGFFPTP